MTLRTHAGHLRAYGTCEVPLGSGSSAALRVTVRSIQAQRRWLRRARTPRQLAAAAAAATCRAEQPPACATDCQAQRRKRGPVVVSVPVFRSERSTNSAERKRNATQRKTRQGKAMQDKTR